MLVKVNKQSDKVKSVEPEEVVITKIEQPHEWNGQQVITIQFLDSKNQKQRLTVRMAGNEDVKKGTAIISQDEWSADSKFGANVSTSIVNVNRMLVSSALKDALA